MSLADDHESCFATGEHIAVGIANFGDAKTIPSPLLFLPTFDNDFLIDRDRLAIDNGHLRGNSAFARQLGELAHGFIENNGDDAAMSKTTTASVIQAQ